MICFSLTGNSLSYNTTLLLKFQSYIDMAELRVDHLDKKQQDWEAIASWAQEIRATHSVPLLLSVRNKNDGGKWEDSEKKRTEILLHAAKSGLFSWIDIESDFDTMPSRTHTTQDISNALAHSHTQLIISNHIFEEPSETQHTSWAEHMMARADTWPNALIKTAMACNSTSALCDIMTACSTLKKRIPHRFIVAPMGVFGVPGRILTAHTGSKWTYVSDDLAHLGQLNPKVLVEEYNYRSISKSTKLYAIIGNPVMHSQSPAFHNKKFRLDSSSPKKAYIPIPVDDCAQFPRLATLLSLQGFSVTVPHKQAVVPYLKSMDEYVTICKSCNTVLIKSDGDWHGHNTDMPGFLESLYAHCARAETTHSPKEPLEATPEETPEEKPEEQSLENRHITIVGAGGTAHTIAYGLLTKKAHILIVNRTLSKAKKLCEQLQEYATRTSVASRLWYAHIHDYEKIAKFSDIIVQTTSVGLHPRADTPLPDYPFTGKELVYEVIYSPAVTTLMRDAQKKGCATVAGMEMFTAQAKLQSALFKAHNRETP